jgi:hypothetical protein
MILCFPIPATSRLSVCLCLAIVASNKTRCVICPLALYVPSMFRTMIGRRSSIRVSCSLSVVSVSMKFPPAPESMSAISVTSSSRWRMTGIRTVCRLISRVVIALMPIEMV